MCIGSIGGECECVCTIGGQFGGTNDGQCVGTDIGQCECVGTNDGQCV